MSTYPDNVYVLPLGNPPKAAQSKKPPEGRNPIKDFCTGIKAMKSLANIHKYAKQRLEDATFGDICKHILTLENLSDVRGYMNDVIEQQRIVSVFEWCEDKRNPKQTMYVVRLRQTGLATTNECRADNLEDALNKARSSLRGFGVETAVNNIPDKKVTPWYPYNTISRATQLAQLRATQRTNKNWSLTNRTTPASPA